MSVGELRRSGRTVAADGPKVALDILRAHEHVDPFIAGPTMPRGMGSITLARAARERQPRIKVLFTMSDAEAFLNRTDSGGSEFEVVNKPYKRLELARRVRRVIDGPTRVG